MTSFAEMGVLRVSPTVSLRTRQYVAAMRARDMRAEAARRTVVVRRGSALLGLAALAALFFAIFATPASAQTFSGPSITVSSTVGASEGSSTVVSGLSGTVSSITVNLSNLDVTGGGLNSVAMVLVSPNGTALDLLSGVCNSGETTITLADNPAGGLANNDGLMPGIGFGNNCPTALSGTYLPTDYFPGLDTFNSPGPSTYDSAGIGPSECGTIGSGVTCGSYNFTSAFGLPASATGLNGTWRLYIANQVPGYSPSGSLGSWSITFTTESASATTTSLTTSNNGVTSTVFTNGDVNGDNLIGTAVTFTATVFANGAPVNAGTVTFYDSTFSTAGNGTVIPGGSAVAVNGTGQASVSVTFPPSEEGSRTISAVYNGYPDTYAPSTSSLLNELTVNHPYNPSGNTFCNGPVKIDNNTSGAAGGVGGYPYPSQLVLATAFRSCKALLRASPLR